MATALKNLSKYDDASLPDCKKIRFGIVVADWNQEITHSLYEACFSTLIKHGAVDKNIITIQVPGAYELTSASALLIENKKIDAVISLGCVIKGETSHNEYINSSVAIGLTELAIKTGIPCIFGLLTPNNWEQAKDRSGGKHGNKGVEAAVTAIRMVDLKTNLSKREAKIGF